MDNTSDRSVIGMDIAKNVFQLHLVSAATGEIRRLKLKRAAVESYFANTPPCLVAMEACGGAHYWGRTIKALGHEVKLLPTWQVNPFVLRDKTDARDAQAISVAALQSHIKAVPVKTENQQICMSLHRMREQMMKMRIMQTNALRGLLYEFGVVLPVGHRALLEKIGPTLAEQDQRLPEMIVQSALEQMDRIHQLQRDIAQIELRLTSISKNDHAMQALQSIPGIGLLTATAMVAKTGDFNEFKSSRQFSAWLGLTPRQTGTGGRIRQLGISKRGDAYLRTLLMHGARAIIARRTHSAWVKSLLDRRPYSVVVAALANKLARTAWAVLTKGSAFNPSHWTGMDVAEIVA